MAMYMYIKVFIIKILWLMKNFKEVKKRQWNFMRYLKNR